MSIQNLIIYKFTSLYHILEEIGLDLNFNIIFVDSENSLNVQVSNLNNYLVISNRIKLSGVTDLSSKLNLSNCFSFKILSISVSNVSSNKF